MNTAPRTEALAAALERRGFARDTTAAPECTAHAHGRDCAAVVYRLTWPGRANRSTVSVTAGECGAVYLTAVTGSTATAQFSATMPLPVVLAAADAAVAEVDTANDATARR
jgi:hypothetical protein